MKYIWIKLKFASFFFLGDLRHITKLKPWGLYDVLVEKYEWDSETAQSFADWLLPMLAFDTAERATAEECLMAPFMQEVWPLNEVPGGGILGLSRGLQCVGSAKDVHDTEVDLAAVDEEEEFDDYDLNHDDLENNLLAMSNSLRIAAAAQNNDVTAVDLDQGVGGGKSGPDGGRDGDGDDGDCFGSTGLFTAM